jgi:hypothetical protein
MLFLLTNWRLVLIGLSIVSGAGLLIYGYEKILHHGEQIVIDKVEKQNENAIKRADKSGNAVDDCYNSGGMWIIASGRCERGVPSNR